MSMINISSNATLSTITNLDEKCFQPNAVDIRLDKLFRVDANSPFILSEDIKQHRKSYPVPLIESEDGSGSAYHIDKGQYEFSTSHHVTIADGEAGTIVPRSTLNRNGLFITCGLYDSGFNGEIGGMIHCNGPAVIYHDTRIGQFVLYTAETLHLYNGSYNGQTY